MYNKSKSILERMIIMTTIKDIAEQAGVSNSTVSRILNGDKILKVSAATREKVLNIASQLNYQKKNDKTDEAKGTIAIMTWYKKEVSLSSLFLRAIRWGVESTLTNSNYKIIRTFFNEENPTPATVDGIIAIGHFDDTSLQSLKALNKPLVVLNQNTLHEDISCVTADYQLSVQNVIQHFLSTGHQSIGMIEGESKSDAALHITDPRSSIFRQEMSKLNLLNEDYIFKGDFNIDSGYQAMLSAIDTLQDNLPTAFFISSDTMAMGALRSLYEKNIAVPQRVSIIGYGDNEVSHYTVPSLSTVSIAARQIGTVGSLTLLNIINGSYTEPIHIVTNTKLVLRESSINELV